MEPCAARIILAILLLSSCTPAPKSNAPSPLTTLAGEASIPPVTGQQHSSDCQFKSFTPVHLSDWLPSGILKSAKPIYPPEARRRRIRGRVLVSVLIDKKGEVERVCSVGDPLLGAAAESAALQFRFRRPTFIDLHRYIKETLVFDFVLEE
jgi:TonB family protein